MRSLVRLALPVSLVVAALFVALRLATGAGGAGSLPAFERPWLLPLACGACFATVACYALLWRTIACGLDGARPSTIDAMATFTCSWLGRNVPSSVPYIAGTIVLGGRLGFRRSTLVASMVYENLIVIGVSCAIGGAILAWTLPQSPPLAWLLLSGAAVAGLAALPSRASRALLDSIARRAPRAAALRECHMPARALLRSVCVAAAGFASNGLAFALLISSFGHLSAAEFVAAIAVFNIAGAAGIAAVPVPSGVGVREALLIPLAHLVVPLDVAIAAALLARLGSLAADLVLGAAGVAWIALRSRAANAGVPALPRVSESQAG